MIGRQVEVVDLTMPVPGSERYVPLPTPADIDAIAAAIELPATILATDALALASRVLDISSTADLRNADAGLAAASEWLADWSTIVAHARERLPISLNRKEVL